MGLLFFSQNGPGGGLYSWILVWLLVIFDLRVHIMLVLPQRGGGSGGAANAASFVSTNGRTTTSTTRVHGPLCLPLKCTSSQENDSNTKLSWGTQNPSSPIQRALSSRHRYLIHWRGEATEGYSMQFRHLEFRGALEAVLGYSIEKDALKFVNALQYSGTANNMPESKIVRYNAAMQFVMADGVSQDALIRASKRCSLVKALYFVEAAGGSYQELLEEAIATNAFQNLKGEPTTWCLRVRDYGTKGGSEKEKRHGSRARSMQLERKALQALTPVLVQLKGKVDLKYPECKIYVFDGIFSDDTTQSPRIVLARRLTEGCTSASLLEPASRLCVTTTPLGPVAALTLCNVARVAPGQRILDVYAGSCATLLAASLVTGGGQVQCVGIEIAHNGIVNREDIRRDFESRLLHVPVLALIEGDMQDDRVRQQALAAVGNEAFDCIVTDPPYGIREALTTTLRSDDSIGESQKEESSFLSPIESLLTAIQRDRGSGRPLLKEKGGRIVVFIPSDRKDVTISDRDQKRITRAGLRMEFMTEQPLNEKLSRWMVSFVSEIDS